ncbi:uncharacterized protein LOC142767673 isoform X1 [Rhipicephalus microplus]|uniref:uncharacterized protein LOC142767673 isoform X1 n=1 Tax=Rhipicephalus microplus TaxID=6941 RepID=UPI003F6D836B
MAATAHVQCALPCHPLMRAHTPDTVLELRTGHMTAWRGALPDPPYEADKREHLGSHRLGCGTLLLGTNLRCFMYQYRVASRSENCLTSDDKDYAQLRYVWA